MKVYLDTIGCRLNQAEIEAMAGQFRKAGHDVVSTPAQADLAVVNTCAVTAQAASDSRGLLRRVAREGGIRVVATGCWATLQPGSAAALPNVWRVVANPDKDRLAADILDIPPEAFDIEPLARSPLPGIRHRTRAVIKVQDGCNNRCTFCVTTIARGRARSRGAAAVIRDVRSALEGGSREIVLTGVHLGSWGQEFGSNLRFLVTAILHETHVLRLRLSSLEPWDLNEDFFRLWEDPRLCRHLHLPLQSGCAATLKRMARKTTPDSFRALITAAREAMSDVAITTDVIAGFPGETEAEFAQSIEFVREMCFAGGHAFTYSPRPGTAAARMENAVPPRQRRERNAIYRSVFEDQANDYRRRFIGQTASVLWESTTQVDERGWELRGLTGNYLRVSACAPRTRWNEIDLVELTAVSPDGLDGVIRK